MLAQKKAEYQIETLDIPSSVLIVYSLSVILLTPGCLLIVGEFEHRHRNFVF